MLQSMGSQRVEHNLATKQQQAWGHLYHLALAANGSHRNITNGERVFKQVPVLGHGAQQEATDPRALVKKAYQLIFMAVP